MQLSRRILLSGAAGSVVGIAGLAACSSGSSGGTGGTNTGSASTAGAGSSSSAGTATTTGSLAFDAKAWNHDATNDVYWQIGRAYAATPAASDYETLGIYVPGAYLKATKNSDGTSTATIDTSGSVGGFTASTAPIVLPVNTPGYSAQKPPTSYDYDSVSSYLKTGFVYVHAGLRGKDSNGTGYTGNAPWGVTDLKAAVRYLRYNADVLPGDKDRIFVFGMSGGGAQSSVMGATGDSPLYTPYLTSIGAALKDANGKTLSDAVAGVMAWCPITSLDQANAAYEWNLGQFAASGTRASGTWTKAYSTDLAKAFAGYVNGLKLTDSASRTLTLTATNSGTYLAGSYHDHLISVIETSLNDFIADTTFPYTPASTGMGGMAGAAGAPPSGGTPPSAASGSSTSSSSSSSTTYATLQDYLDHLNGSSPWITYDATTKKATVTSLAGFVTSQKTASKDVGAFDGVGRAATENVVLGLGTTGLHFAPVSKDVIAANESAYATLSGWNSSYAASGYTSDFATKDSIGTDVATRLDMYNPMYFLNSSYDGYKTSTVAPHWRIRTGIMQGDTASTVEVNLALALQNYGVTSVDFATVWGQAHTMAERTGDATTNLITWVKEVAGS